MRTSEQTADIDKALAAAQHEMRNPGFDRKNTHFKNEYATLAAVRDAVIPVLAKHGISLTQELISDEGRVGCLTMLRREGQWLEYGPFWVPASKFDAQGFGSAATYARRYAMNSVAGVAGDVDDDAETASEGRREERKTDPVEPIPTFDEMRDALDSAAHIAQLNTRWSNIKKLVAKHYSGDEEMLRRLEGAYTGAARQFEES